MQTFNQYILLVLVLSLTWRQGYCGALPRSQQRSAVSPWWGQCGGEGYTGPTQCAPGSSCVYGSHYWSMCTPNGQTTVESGATASITSSNPTNSNNYLISEDEFKKALTSNNCPTSSYDKYASLVSQAQSKGGIRTRQELAMFLAQILWESDCLRATSEYACANGCPGAYPLTGYGIPGKQYFGRGYIQLVMNSFLTMKPHLFLN
jgi:hypothetical protein